MSRSHFKVINRAHPGHSFYIYAYNWHSYSPWGAASHLKHMLRYVERHCHTWRLNYKMVLNWACPGNNFYIYAFIANDLAQLFIWNICLGKLKVKVTLKGQTIKWSLGSVNILNWNFWFINIKMFCCVSMMLFGFCLINEWISSSHAYRSLKLMAGSTSCPWATILNVKVSVCDS